MMPISTVLEISNSVVMLLLLMEVAGIKRSMKRSEKVEYQEPPLLTYLKGVTN